jgi:hypothetical protein
MPLWLLSLAVREATVAERFAIGIMYTLQQ